MLAPCSAFVARKVRAPTASSSGASPFTAIGSENTTLGGHALCSQHLDRDAPRPQYCPTRRPALLRTAADVLEDEQLADFVRRLHGSCGAHGPGISERVRTPEELAMILQRIVRHSTAPSVI
jgi:hypothetical protein